MAAQVLGLACWLLAGAASAHPGHAGADAGSWLHGLEPAHIAPALLVAALGLAARALAREQR